MKPLVFVVDDDEKVIFTIQSILEMNNYEIITANDGEKALKTLEELPRTPDIIISDIMMPKVNGYDFFKEVSSDPRWSDVPFIFATAKTSLEDIRFGKMLGVDDYLTKPFFEEDLLATIKGKLKKSERIKSVNKKIQELISLLDLDADPSKIKEPEKSIVLLHVIWDDKLGPILNKSYPEKTNFPISLTELAQQLFQAIISIYGYDDIQKAESILLNIENIKKKGFVFFDSYKDTKMRGGEKQYMLALIAPNINYFESLKIKPLMEEISVLIKNNKKWNIKNYWKDMNDIVLSPSL